MSQKNKKRKLEGEEQTMSDWEQENIFLGKTRHEMESMWELPQIFHFLHLTKETLNIPHLSMYEMERMLLIPRASKQLANIMTSLLSSPITKAKLRKIPPMPYEFWTNILAYKIKSWFKIYEGKHRDAVKVLETIGVEPEFWNVFPDAPLLNGKDFEELSFKQKVWLLKTICDTVMHTRKTVHEEIAKQPWEDQFETVLGTDRYGARYIYFPQFLKSDLRVYRHCLDNKILSSVKPIKPKLKTGTENKILKQTDSMRKKAKYKKRKTRWSNGLSTKSRKKVNKSDKKESNDCKCTSDSATSSLNKDADLSSTSTCNNNNNNNNNNSSDNKNKKKINLDIINGKRSRSLSKCSEMSAEPNETHCKNVNSSGCDTTSSLETTSDARLPGKMFKGFSDSSSNEKCNIEILSGILSNLKSETSEEKGTDDVNDSSTHTSQIKVESNPMRQYLDTMDLGTGRSGSVDNLSNISKTDDEKLNEIISAECLKLGDKGSSNFHTVRETHQISTTSKSDDEKLNETKTGHSTPEDNVSLIEETTEYKITRQSKGLVKDQKRNDLIARDKRESQPGQSSDVLDESESDDEQNLSLSELRRILQREAMDDDSEIGYNLRKVKNEKSHRWTQEVQDFNGMLLELGVSKFQLVADSVDSLRDLISTFLQKSNNPSADTDDDIEPIPQCEVKLVKKLSDLLASLKEMESALCDSFKKARAKLQRELANLKEGVECQDSSGEGVGSNWWVLGSQGYPLPTSGDATFQTLPQSTLSPTGHQSNSNKNEERQEKCVSLAEDSKQDPQECKDGQGENASSELQRGEDNSQESTGAEEEAKEGSNYDEGQETRRVLRARGVSSYTEQFYSDDEIEENELEEWANVEAVYAAPSAQASTSTPYFSAKIKYADGRTNEEEDSDQDWILPSSRKRKNKRPSANRRLKSFEHKLQSIKVDELQEAAESLVATPSIVKNEKDKLTAKDTQIRKSENITDSKAFEANAAEANHEAVPESHEAVAKNQEAAIEKHEAVAENHVAVVENNSKKTVPSAETISNIENFESVHSELDIKDEGPIYDYAPCQVDNGYTPTLNSNYMVIKTEPNPMNYYVMQPNTATVVSPNTIMQPGPMVSSIVPPVQQGYYVHGGQNYIIQNPQPGVVPHHSLQPQGPQMITPQQFVNHPGYVPYMVATAHPQREFIPANPQFYHPNYHQNPPMPTHSNPDISIRPSQNRYPISRHNYPHPTNGAVIRSNMPIRGNFPRTNNARLPRSMPQPRGSPARAPRPRKTNTSSESQAKTTSLIVLSDSDDEIEMIVTQKTGSTSETGKTKTTPRRNSAQNKQTPTVISDITVATPKGSIPQQIIQRMSQGGISITPVKPAPPVQSPNTQLVVVVNDTGSHYALALPNGSKLILTPEQVAQIRASNGGKLIL
ncbi:serine/threonine-protein kinase pakD-like [Colletes gigas]|uniref:serine/threonine-protein kinase pakD-like n=1 Tax=Colletes gigas TaxID=935657 RepID=UPI001C9AEB3B|nr:serine/threonine-protein kinase pakD-like [Colletes gigas]